MTVEPEAEGGYSAYVDYFPGATSQGETVDEAIYMAVDAAKELMAHRSEKGEMKIEPMREVRVNLIISADELERRYLT